MSANPYGIAIHRSPPRADLEWPWRGTALDGAELPVTCSLPARRCGRPPATQHLTWPLWLSSEYLRRSCVRLSFSSSSFSLSLFFQLSFLSFRPASVCLNARSCAYVAILRYICTVHFYASMYVRIYARIYSIACSKTISFDNKFFNIILISFQWKIILLYIFYFIIYKIN